MKSITIKYVIGDETKELKIEFLASGGGHIMMDKYYHGQAVFAQGQWRVYLADKSELNNSDDIQILIQLLTEQCQ
jgi:hypothetical protein